MSDPTAPDPVSTPVDLEVALVDFLPDGVTCEGGADAEVDEPVGDQSGEAEVDEPTAELPVEADGVEPTAELPVEADGVEPTEDQAVETEVAEQPDRATDAGHEAAVAPAPAAEDEIDLTLLDAVERDLGAVDAALAALDDGSYGTCAVCRTPIPAEVLAGDPVRRTCPEHA